MLVGAKAESTFRAYIKAKHNLLAIGKCKALWGELHIQLADDVIVLQRTKPEERTYNIYINYIY